MTLGFILLIGDCYTLLTISSLYSISVALICRRATFEFWPVFLTLQLFVYWLVQLAQFQSNSLFAIWGKICSCFIFLLAYILSLLC